VGTLNAKQKLFCEEYIIDLNAKAAYIRAGYKDSASASANAARLIADDSVRAYVEELKAGRSQALKLTAEKVLQEIARVAFSNICEVMEFDSAGVNVKDSANLTEDTTAAIASVSETKTETEVSTTTRITVKLHNKISALSLAAKHLGLLGDMNQAKAVFATYGIEFECDDYGKPIRIKDASDVADSEEDFDILSEVDREDETEA
jgi:phage terminase small subunit